MPTEYEVKMLLSNKTKAFKDRIADKMVEQFKDRQKNTNYNIN